MNIYLLVEGRRTEKRVYTNWFLGSIPLLEESAAFDEVGDNSLFCFSGEGFPSVIERALPNAVRDIRDVNRYDALVLVFDCDDNDVDALRGRALQVVEDSGGLPPRIEFVIVLQKRCIESWFLGNKRFVPRVAQSSDLIDCKRFFDVTLDCPEQMSAPATFSGSISAFHLHYLKAAFRERHLTYSKARPSEAASLNYLGGLRARYEEGHLPGMAALFDFFDRAQMQGA